MKRVFLIVLDSFGVGEMKDSPEYGDVNVNTLRSCSSSRYFKMPNMQNLGLFNIDGVELAAAGKPESADTTSSLKVEKTEGLYCRIEEASKGKDTTTGHWEIAGVVSDHPMPTFPNGFPKEFLDAFSKRVGRGVICNMPYSGTEVIQDYGDEHCKTGNLIVYTSADSVFQIAAHEDVVPLEELYEDCHIAREMLQGELGVGRVIARPFIGTSGKYERTPKRHDYSLVCPKETLLDALQNAGKDVIGVGKIHDIFAGKGLTEFTFTSGNEEGIEKTLEYLDKDFDGLCFVNLVDFDMLYGHRRDIDGYAKALAYFDEKLAAIKAKMRDEDVLMITADHGCDPAYTATTDHTREHIPFVVYGKNVEPKNMGTRKTYTDIAASVAKYLGVEYKCPGTPIF